MDVLKVFLPATSVKKIHAWIKELDVNISVVKSRKTKLGDFKVKNGQMFISVNCSLNQYAFLITLTHELAHAFVYVEYPYKVRPHGLEWQWMFKSMLLNFLSADYFPDDILKALSLHLKKPKASTFSDIFLSLVLQKYDRYKKLTLFELRKGEKFIDSNGKIFLKGKKIRKRIECVEQQTNKIYFFHPLAEVSVI